MPNDYDISVEDGERATLTDDEVRACCDATLARVGVERPCMVSISFVSEGRIRALNAEWRGQDRPTDVISLECERPDDPALAPGEPCELGDVVLAPTYIERQAGSFGTTVADESRLLLSHGVLHLLGIDHLSDEDAERMEELEEAILSDLPGDGTINRVVLTRHREGDDA